MEKIKEIIIEKINKSKLDIEVVFKETDGTATNPNRLSIEPTAQYEPSSKTIYVSLKKINEMLADIQQEEKAAYLDSLIAHELGHATDCNVEKSLNDLKGYKAKWKEALVYLLGRDQNDDTLHELRELYTRMRSINLELEKRAWELGRNFSQYPAIFEKFNQKNMSTYQHIYGIYGDMLNRIATEK